MANTPSGQNTGANGNNNASGSSAKKPSSGSASIHPTVKKGVSRSSTGSGIPTGKKSTGAVGNSNKLSRTASLKELWRPISKKAKTPKAGMQPKVQSY